LFSRDGLSIVCRALKQGRRAWKGELKEIAHVRATRLILLALGAAFLAVTSCLLDSGGDIHGIDGFVSDNQGRPVAGVVIRKTGAESGSTYTRADGYYWIGVNPRSYEVTLSPAKPGWAFCPGKRVFADLAERRHDADFTGYFAGQVVIDGFVLDPAGNPVEGVPVVNRESGIFLGLTSITNHLGYYCFYNVVSGHDYRFVPVRSGCTFEPPERLYLDPVNDHRGDSFRITCVGSFGVEGRVTDSGGRPVGGVTLDFEPAGLTAVTGGDGRYARYGLSPAAEITITPSAGGCVFKPASSNIEAPAGNVTGVDFEAYCGETHEVSGRVRDDTGNPSPNIGVSIEGGWYAAERSTATDETGFYRFDSVPGGFDYKISPERIGLIVQPEFILIYSLDRDYTGQDFAYLDKIETFTISGHVLSRDGEPLEAVEIRAEYIETGAEELAAAEPGKAGSPPEYVSTDETGHYSVQILSGSNVRISPYREGCTFIPYARWYYGDREIESQDYRAFCGDGYTICGYVRTPDGDPVRGVRVEAAGEDYYPPPVVYTDSTGYYRLANLPSGLELTVEPSARYSIPYEGCIFCPPSRVYPNLSGDLRDQDFTISCPSLSGSCCRSSGPAYPSH
jgi:protocatechuate 3,4-dioxygenase beta subunit